MPKAEAKTKPTEVSVDSFIEKIGDETMRDDSKVIIKLMKKVSGDKPKMWGPAIIGFGQYHYKYESGHEGDICRLGFSPRKANLTLYVLNQFKGQDDLLKKLGKHKTGKGCLYIKKLDDIDVKVLETIIEKSLAENKKKHP